RTSFCGCCTRSECDFPFLLLDSFCTDLIRFTFVFVNNAIYRNMGLASGKLTLHHVEDKHKPETNDAAPHKTVETPETASQLVNGDASVMSNVPAIDDEQPEKPVGEARTEVIQTVDEVPGPNGTVHAGHEGAETHETEKRKSKDPLGWIKRRLSKKSSTTKPESAELEHPIAGEQGDSPKADETTETPSIPEAHVTETAESLVNEVISSAVAAEQEQEVDTTPPSAVAEELQMSTKHETTHAEPTDVVEETEPATSPVEPEPTPMAEDEPACEEHHDQVQEEQEVPVTETNNTNVTGDEAYDDTNIAHDSTDLPEPIFSKLADLDLTNGHPEQHLSSENGHEAEPTEASNRTGPPSHTHTHTHKLSYLFTFDSRTQCAHINYLTSKLLSPSIGTALFPNNHFASSGASRPRFSVLSLSLSLLVNHSSFSAASSRCSSPGSSRCHSFSLSVCVCEVLRHVSLILGPATATNFHLSLPSGLSPLPMSVCALTHFIRVFYRMVGAFVRKVRICFVPLSTDISFLPPSG
ncbi:hypothetical protein T265_14060, partial [Opisthorchis viverrini]